MTTAERYRQLRAQHPGISARNAYAHATAQAPSDPGIEWHGETGTWTTDDGWTMRVRLEPDTCADLPDWLGEFVDRRTPDAIPSPRAHAPAAFQTAAWFVPSEPVEAIRATLSGLGYGRGVAETMARAQVRDMAQAACDYAPFVVVVTASREGVELGSAVVGGMDVGDAYAPYDAYVLETIADLAREAITDACGALERLTVAR